MNVRARRGDAYVGLGTAEEGEMLMRLNGKKTGTRTIVVRKAEPGELAWALKCYAHPPNGDYTGVVRLRGFPRDTKEVRSQFDFAAATESRCRHCSLPCCKVVFLVCWPPQAEVAALFADFATGDPHGDVDEPVYMCVNKMGRRSGDAFVVFKTAEEAAAAITAVTARITDVQAAPSASTDASAAPAPEPAASPSSASSSSSSSDFARLTRRVKLFPAIKGELYGKFLIAKPGIPKQFPGAPVAAPAGSAAPGPAASAMPVASPAEGSLPGAAFVQLQGLQYSVTDGEVRGFLAPCKVPEGGVIRQTGRGGRFSGAAVAALASAEDEAIALGKHKQYMGSRYVEVTRLSRDEADSLTGGAVTRPGGSFAGFVCLSGLPFAAKPHDMVELVRPARPTINGVWLVNEPGGRASGDAFVEFATEAEAAAAAKDVDGRDCMGRRVRASQATRAALWAALAQSAGDRGRIGRGTQDNCIQLSGLPFSATEEQLQTFFAGFTLVNAVVVRERGSDRATGSAFVQLGDAAAVMQALCLNRQELGGRYAELVPCNEEQVQDELKRAGMIAGEPSVYGRDGGERGGSGGRGDRGRGRRGGGRSGGGDGGRGGGYRRGGGDDYARGGGGGGGYSRGGGDDYARGGEGERARERTRGSGPSEYSREPAAASRPQSYGRAQDEDRDGYRRG